MRPVPKSKEFLRVLALPRRKLQAEQYDPHDPLYCRPGSSGLWPIQAAALAEARKANGLFAPIGVGHGKTLISLLLPTALRSSRAAVLVPPQLKKQLSREIPKYAEAFKIDLEALHVLSYTDLSRKEGASSLDEIHPDLVIADEAHCLRHKTSARTKRFLRYMRQNPGTRFCALSGTMTTRSVLDYAHLLELALGKNSPLPNTWHELQDWSGALDVNPAERLAPGVLAQLGEGEVRSIFRERLTDTAGVVATKDSSLGTSLFVQTYQPKMSSELDDTIKQVRNEWRVGDEEIVDASHMGQVMAQLHSGFHYLWKWPAGTSEKFIRRWKKVRAEWHRELRNYLRRSRPGLDSPALVMEAVDRGSIKHLEQSLASWRAAAAEAQPTTVPVWLDTYLVGRTKNWRAQSGIIWYKHGALGDLLREAGYPVYGLGADAGEATEDIIACSLQSQGTGKNLQRYRSNLLLEMPSSGTLLEQVIGRTHRPGQEADNVTVEFIAHPHNRKCMKKCVQDAEYVQSTTGQRQKILYAQRIGW